MFFAVPRIVSKPILAKIVVLFFVASIDSLVIFFIGKVGGAQTDFSL
jgi:hypothetical protein